MGRRSGTTRRVVTHEEGSVTLRVHCVHCGRAVTLRFQPVPDDIVIESVWTCPYHDCRKDAVNRIGLSGVLMHEWPGHRSDPKPGNTIH